MGNLGPLESLETRAKVTSIIEASFDTRPMPSGSITWKEVSRRVEMAKEIFRVLWNEARWTETRILDHLPAFIARGLDGEEPIPDWAKRRVEEGESAMWGAEAAGRVKPEARLSALSHAGGEPLIVVPGRSRS